MNLYSTLVFVHVLTAILGLGPLITLALASSSPTPVMSVRWFNQLLRMTGWSLGGMLVTGILLVAQTHGALGHAGWMRVSVGLFLVLGFVQNTVQRRLKRSRKAQPDGPLPQGLRPLLWSMCALVAAITYLMEAKPW